MKIMSFDFLIYLGVLVMSCVIYSSGFSHFLQMLIALEFVVISSLVLMAYYLYMSEGILMCVYFMIFSVCEAILGLTLMIMMVRYSGNEYMKGISLGKW